MVKNNQEAESGPPSSDSDASPEKEGSPSTPPPPVAVDKSAIEKKLREPAAEKSMDSGSESVDPDYDSPLKAIASKLKDDGSKVKRPRSKPNSKPFSPAKMSTKRPAEAEVDKDSKKSKTEEGGGGGEEDGKKSVLFQRLWGDDDEIAILQGMLDYKEKNGADPMANLNGFHDFIKKSLHVDVDRRQTVDKVRRLKKRYENSAWKRKTFNPHEMSVLELSKKIWGYDMERADLDQQSKSSMKTRTISKAAASTKSGSNAGFASPARNGPVVTHDGKNDVGNREQFIGKATLSMGLDDSIVKVGLELCREDRKAEIEEKWRKLHLEESDLFLRKLDLARLESEMIIAAFKSGC